LEGLVDAGEAVARSELTLLESLAGVRTRKRAVRRAFFFSISFGPYWFSRFWDSTWMRPIGDDPSRFSTSASRSDLKSSFASDFDATFGSASSAFRVTVTILLFLLPAVRPPPLLRDALELLRHRPEEAGASLHQASPRLKDLPFGIGDAPQPGHL